MGIGVCGRRPGSEVEQAAKRRTPMRYGLTALAFLLMLGAMPTVPLRAAEIPLGTSGGIYTVPVQVNRSVTIEFLVDPGAGVVVIPVAVLRSLIQNGTVTEGDLIGMGTAETADKSMYVTAHVRLRELRIGNIVAHDVTAAIAPGLTQPLLGQSFLQRFATVTFDNRRRAPDFDRGLPEPGCAIAGHPSVCPHPLLPAARPVLAEAAIRGPRHTPLTAGDRLARSRNRAARAALPLHATDAFAA